MTKAQVATRALQALGVLYAGQSASAEDQDIAEATVQTVYDLLRAKPGLPFAITAVQEWAQLALAHIAAQEMAPAFGVTGERFAAVAALAGIGRQTINEQMQAKHHVLAPGPDYY